MDLGRVSENETGYDQKSKQYEILNQAIQIVFSLSHFLWICTHILTNCCHSRQIVARG